MPFEKILTMYRTILVHVDTEPGSAQRTCLAADVARHFQANLIGITAALPRPPVEALSAGIGAAGLMDLEREQITENFKTAERQFRTLAAESGVRIEWRAVANFPTFALASAASAADLVIIGPETSGLIRNDYWTVNPGELLIRAGRPLLIAPPEASGLDVRNVLVAWKDTREAHRAVFDALPFLKRAESVNLVEIRENGETDSFRDAEAFLSAHAVRVHAESRERDFDEN